MHKRLAGLAMFPCGAYEMNNTIRIPLLPRFSSFFLLTCSGHCRATAAIEAHHSHHSCWGNCGGAVSFPWLTRLQRAAAGGACTWEAPVPQEKMVMEGQQIECRVWEAEHRVSHFATLGVALMRNCKVYSEPSEPPTAADGALLSFHEPTVSHRTSCQNTVAAAIAPASHLKIALVINLEKKKKSQAKSIAVSKNFN